MYVQCKLYSKCVQYMCVNTVDNGRFCWQQAILPVLPLPYAHSILDTNFVLINSKFTSQYFIAARVSGHYLDPCLHCICYCQCCLVWRACAIHSYLTPTGVPLGHQPVRASNTGTDHCHHHHCHPHPADMPLLLCAVLLGVQKVRLFTWEED